MIEIWTKFVKIVRHNIILSHKETAKYMLCDWKICQNIHKKATSHRKIHQKYQYEYVLTDWSSSQSLSENILTGYQPIEIYFDWLSIHKKFRLKLF